MIFLYLIAILLPLLGIIVYKKGTANAHYFEGRGVKSMKPDFMFGNSTELFLGKTSSTEFMKSLYNQFPGERLFGTFILRRPALILRDPELVKRLFVKEFDHFTDHQGFLDESMDKLLGGSLFNLTGQKWRDMRTTLSPAFTGRKMRLMCDLMVEVGNSMIETLSATFDDVDPAKVQRWDIGDLSKRFATDIIALCAFGVKVDSLRDKENSFYLAGSRVNFDSASSRFKFIGLRACPSLFRLLNIELLDGDTKKFFHDLVVNTMKEREEQKIVRPDLISLLMQAQQGLLAAEHAEEEEKEKHLESAGFATVIESKVSAGTEKGTVEEKKKRRAWSLDELMAQCFIFFLGGFDTTSSVMSFAFYELAVNEEVQEKLFAEIKETEDALEGKEINYEGIQRMKYMDMVVSETLRKWPPGPMSDRICVKPLDFDDQNGLKFKFEKDLIIVASISGLHSDPKYFPEPEKFKPERFSGENQEAINTDVYLPFGTGPRNCIASRFALMEIKVLLYKLIGHFKLHVVEETEIPITLMNGMGVPKPKNPIRLGMSRRN